MHYVVKYRDNSDPYLDGYMSSPGENFCCMDHRSDAYHFETGIEALAEAERLNRDEDENHRDGTHIILPVLKKRPTT